MSINPATGSPSDFRVFRDGKRETVRELNDRVSRLRRLERLLLHGPLPFP